MKTRHYRDLQVWQRSMDLAKQIYQATASFPNNEAYGLTSQLRRAAVSVPSNIAEGQGRSSDRSFAVFLRQTRGSMFELQTQIELARNLGLLNNETHNALLGEGEEIARMLNGLLRTLHSSYSEKS